MKLSNRPSRLAGSRLGAIALLITIGLLPSRVGAVESWLTVPNLPEERSRMQAVGHDGLLYVFGGLNLAGDPLATFRTYDADAGSWSPELSMPSTRHSFCLAKAGATAYLIGGVDQSGLTTTVHAYDLELGFWNLSVAPLPEIAEGAAAAVVSGVVYVIGGYTGSGYTSQTWALHPFQNVWSPLTPMSFPRVHHTAVAKDGLIYVFGGFDQNDGVAVREVEVYDPATDSWTMLAGPMASHRSYHGAALVNGRIFAVGGNAPRALDRVCVLGPMQGQSCWDNLDCLGFPLCNMTAEICAGGPKFGLPCLSAINDPDCTPCTPLNALICMGGQNNGDGCPTEWSPCPDGRCGLPIGVCAGGTNDGGACLGAISCPSGACWPLDRRSSVVELDTTTGLFRSRLDLSETRVHVAVAAVGGLLYAVGGEDTGANTWPMRTVEVYTGTCGDGFVSSTEQCDDGNVAAGDGCDTEPVTALCQVESDWQCTGSPSVCDGICGDGVERGTETCDDSNGNNCDGCDVDCRVETGGCCGDGALDADEECDDGGFIPGDGCTERCAVESGWACAGEPSVCSVVCGDGTVLAAEACDDGGLADGDGCASDCTVEDFWTCEGEPSLCSTECGDGTVLGAEECDDGSILDNDGCASDCTLESGWTCEGEPSLCNPSCGDATVDPSEACDDGNLDPGDGCSASCEIEQGWTCSGEPSVCTDNSLCGNGLMDAAEQCDDGNADDDDGCSADCVVQDDWTCEGQPSVCEEVVTNKGCGCASGGPGGDVPAGLLWMIVLLWILKRRSSPACN